jgi:chaperonin cofactor prefoldin
METKEELEERLDDIRMEIDILKNEANEIRKKLAKMGA